MNLIQDVNSLFDMFQMDVYPLIDMTPSQKEEALSQIQASPFDQFEEVCQGGIDKEYLKCLIFTLGVDHIILMRLKNLVLAMAILSEKKTADSRKYMEIDILCARKDTSMGKQMLLASENLSLRRGFTFTSLSSLPTAMGFYKRMGYKSITPEQTCREPSQKDTLVLDVYEESKRLLSLERVNTFSGMLEPVQSKVTTILRNLQISDEDIAYLDESYGPIVDVMNQMLVDIDIEKSFDSGNLIMSKCLINSSTVGIFNQMMN
jgi:hypothetical protein